MIRDQQGGPQVPCVLAGADAGAGACAGESVEVGQQDRPGPANLRPPCHA